MHLPALNGANDSYRRLVRVYTGERRLKRNTASVSAPDRSSEVRKQSWLQFPTEVSPHVTTVVVLEALAAKQKAGASCQMPFGLRHVSLGWASQWRLDWSSRLPSASQSGPLHFTRR